MTIRFGMCCVFRDTSIKFRRTTVRFLQTLPRSRQLEILSDIALANAESLLQALSYCHDRGIGAFRINSQILPVITHPDAGYKVEDLPRAAAVVKAFRRCGRYARSHDIRTSFHPDQFIVLNSPDEQVLARAVADLRYHAMVAEWVGADVINLHGGGAYGDKPASLKRLATSIGRLPKEIRRWLTLENDDRVFTPGDLLPVCEETGTPLVYDVHHHRCLPDGMDEETITQKAIATWKREPLFHLSSPLNGWSGRDRRQHHDHIDPADFPCAWSGLRLTVDIEAKAKETAVLKLRRILPPHLARRCF